MHPDPTNKNSIKRRFGSNVWLTAFILAVLVVATIAAAGACIYHYATRSDFQISLYQGIIADNKRTLGRTTAQTTESPVIKNQTSRYTGTQAQQFDFRVSDDQNVWSSVTTVELFQYSYKNKDGQITVQSSDDNKVVAPGTGGSYNFSLKNASKLNSNYQVWLESDVSVAASGIPIEFRMSGRDGWTDGTGKWLTADELNKIIARKNLYSGKSTEYTLYWRWPFDRGQDEADTVYGNASAGVGSTADGSMNVSQSVSYRITLHTLATEGLIGEEITPTAISDNTGNNTGNTGTGSNTGNTGTNSNTDNNSTTADSSHTAADTTTARKSVKTGDTTDLAFWFLLLAAAGITVSAVFCQRKRRKHDKPER